MAFKLPFFGDKKGAQPTAAKTEAQLAEEARRVYQQGLTTIRDIIAPAGFVVTPDHLQLGGIFARTIFVYTYPQFLDTSWLSSVINYPATLDISMFITPEDSSTANTKLERQFARLESSRQIREEKHLVRDPSLDLALQNIDEMRQSIAQGNLRLFHYSLYITIYADSLEELKTVSKQIESGLAGLQIFTKEALLQMEQGLTSTLPICRDELDIKRNLDTGSLSTTFPFSSAELTSDTGILYGLNVSNDSLIIFDRFKLENANSIVLAKSGGGKSFAVKLECLRYLMLGTDVIVVDPENEYQTLAEAVGGSFIEVSLGSAKRINPFDLPKARVSNNQSQDDDDDANVLKSHIGTLSSLIRLMVGGVSPEEDGILDTAIRETYAMKDITDDPDTHKNPPPILGDLVQVLQNIRGSDSLIQRLTKYTEGTFGGLFNNPTNFELKGGFTVFSVRDLEESLRPVAMFVVLNYVWNEIRSQLKPRIMVVDEAWWMMQYEDSARFLSGMAKRARKYYLGMTIISQDVEDFLENKWGKPIVSNSSMQLLLKQSSSSVEKVAEVFNLTEQEKLILLSVNVGEGLFFAGQNHVLIRVIASYTENRIITSNPQELLSLY